MSLTEAQKRANEKQKQKQKRAGRPRLPGLYLTDNEQVLVTEMGEKYGSKKAIADYIECSIYKTII